MTLKWPHENCREGSHTHELYYSVLKYLADGVKTPLPLGDTFYNTDAFPFHSKIMLLIAVSFLERTFMNDSLQGFSDIQIFVLSFIND